MPGRSRLFRRRNAWRSGWALGVLCWLGIGAAHAQSLDLQSGTVTDAAPVAQPTPGTPPLPVSNDTPAASAAKATPAELSLDHPSAVDTARLVSGSQSVTLYGITRAQQPDLVRDFNTYLGAVAAKLQCQAQADGDFVCLTADGTDIAEAALRNGAAQTKDDAPQTYHDQEAAAQAERRGLWASLPPPPVALHNPVVRDTATLVADSQAYTLDGLIGFPSPYAGELQGYLAAHGNALTCQPQPSGVTYVCVTEDGTDIAKTALVNGAARVGPDAPDSYRVQQADALANHRGYWLAAPPDIVLASTQVLPPPPCCAILPGDDGTDGITYLGGVPTAVIAGETTFLVFSGVAGWGYYDHWHHWRGAPDRYRYHLEHFHPEGHGLRGYEHGGFHHDAFHEAALHPGMAHAGPPGYGHPGFGVPGPHAPGMVPGHPGMAPAGRPMAVAAGHPPGFPAGGGFVRPGPSAGGFHPAGPGGGLGAHPAMPVAHASLAPANVKKH